MRGFFRWLEKRRYKTHVRILLAKYRRFVPCPTCGGAKLKPEALNVRVEGMTIAEVGRLAVRELKHGWSSWVARRARSQRAGVVLRELKNRVGYLDEVGLGYLTRRAAGAHALGRRGAADPSRERARQPADRHALRARRADGRTARRRRAPAARGAAPSARPRQHGGGGRARSDDDRGRRFHRRTRTRRRPRGRQPG